MKAHAGILESDPPELAREKLEAVLPEGEEKPWFRERLLPLLGIEAGSAAGSRRVVHRLAPVPRADGGRAADRARVRGPALGRRGDAGVPRPSRRERSRGAAARRLDHPTRSSTTAIPSQGADLPTVRLAPLSEAETGQLVAGLLETTVLPAELQQAILDRAGGNPLFTQEFVALLRDRGLIVPKGPSWELREGAEVPLPDSVQAVIAARLDTLDPATKSLLGDAAVIGKVFWAGAVAAMGDRDPVAAAATLGELVRRELVAPARRSSMAGEAEYAFGHALVRDVAYEQLPRAARAARHLAAATWIEAKVADRVEDFADVLAHHYATALELARAADEPEQAAALEAPALRFLTLAGERALGLDSTRRRSRASSARSRSRRPATRPVPRRLRASARPRTRPAARTRRSRRSRRRSTRSAPPAMPAGAARAAVVLSETVRLPAQSQPARTCSPRSLALLEPLPPGPEHVAVLTEIADEHQLLGEYETGLDVADRALALAAELGLGRPARTLCFHGGLRHYLGDSAGGIEELRDAMEIAVETGQGRQIGVIYNWLGSARNSLDGPAASLETRNAGIAFCRARGLTARANFLAMNSTSQLFELGELDQALAISLATAERSREEGNVFEVLRAHSFETSVLLLRGQADRIATLPDDLESALDDSAHRQVRRSRLSMSARIRAALGQRDASIALLNRIVDEHLGWTNAEVLTAIGLGDIGLAERLTGGGTGAIAHAAIAEARGDLETAIEAYAGLAGRHRARGEIVSLAQALVGLGRALARLGRSEEAAAALAEARPILAQIGAAPLLAETDALLEQLTALSA